MSKLTKKQQDLLRKVAHRIRTEPAAYDQREWGCGTVACIYGHAVQEAGYVPTEWGWEIVKRPRGTVEYDIVDIGDRLLGADVWVDRSIGLWDGGWRPKGYKHGMGKRALANRVAAALEGLADGKMLSEV